MLLIKFNGYDIVSVCTTHPSSWSLEMPLHNLLLMKLMCDAIHPCANITLLCSITCKEELLLIIIISV